MDTGEFVFPAEADTPQKPQEPRTEPPVPQATTPAKPATEPVLGPHDVPYEGKLLLDAISGTESGGKYNIRYDGGAGSTFNSYADHPRIKALITSGEHAGEYSTASGRYQMIASTWDKAAGAVGATDFSPANQDRAAWWLAKDAYRRNTGGGDLLADLKAGQYAKVQAALGGEWEGIRKAGAGGFAARYQKAAANGPSAVPVPAPFSDDQLLGGYRSSDPTARNYSFMDAADAAFKSQTTLGIMSDYLGAPTMKPERFEWTPDLVKEKLGDLDKATQEYIRNTAVSPDHVDWLRSDALRRMDEEKAIASQGFLGGAALLLGAGLVDLPGYLAGGVAGKAITAARGLSAASRMGNIAAHAAGFAAFATPLEATKYALSPGYGAGDVAEGLAMAALFGGGFGALGEAGAAYASRFKKFTGGAQSPSLDPALVEASKAEYAKGLSADIAAAPPPVIEPTTLDKFANKLGGWADFSVGGRLYHSKNDVISELAPKLTTIATQNLNKGARDVEGALDFVHRTSVAFNMKLEHALSEFYEPWAKEQGLGAWDKFQRRGDFFDQAVDYHTNPNWETVENVDPHVKGFVEKARDLFAEHLDLAKAYGVKGAEKLETDPTYLPRYFERAKWRATRAKYGIEGIEDVVAQAIKAGDPELASRVGSRVVGRAAERDATNALKGEMQVDPATGKKTFAPNPERRAIANKENATTEAIVGQHKDAAAKDLKAVDAQRQQDRASAELDAKDKITAQKAGAEETLGPNSPISREGIKQAIDAEIVQWEQAERAARDAAKALPEAAAKERAKLIKEADDLRDFHQGLRAEADAAWQEAMEAQGSITAQENLAARTEERIRKQSIEKDAQRASEDIRSERDVKEKATREGGENIKAAEIADVKARYWLEAFNKRMARYEEQFTRRVARKYVQTVDASIEGAHPDIDRSFSMRDTELVKQALREQGIAVDEHTADALAEMIAPSAQRGPRHFRHRTTLDEHTPYMPNGGKEGDAFALRDLMDSDYEQIVSRYTRSMAPHYIMAEHGFQSESSARKYVQDAVTQFKGIDGYNDASAYRDRKRANYLLDLIYGKDPLRDIDPKWRGRMAVISNLSYARVGGSFGTAQTYDSAEIVLRHGLEAAMRGMPAIREFGQVLKGGGPEADALVRDLQIFAGIGTKGAEAKIVPKFKGLDDVFADDMTGNWLKKAMRTSKGLSNAVGHASGLNALTDTQHLYVGRMFLQTIADVTRGMRTVEPRLLADFGLSAENLQKFGALLQHAKYDERGIIEDLNSKLLRQIDLQTFDQMMGLTRREAFRTIIEPNAGLMPMLAGSNVFGKFAFQLKSFAAVSNAVHSVGNFRLGPAYVAKSIIGGAVWATALYSMWTYARSLGRGEEERAKYLEKAFAPDKMAFNVWNRVGMAGITPEIIGAGLAAGQRFGVLPKDEDGSNYGQAARASGLMPGAVTQIPVVDMIGSVFDSLQTGVDMAKTGRGMSRYEARRLASLFPLQNAMGISQAINAVTSNMPESVPKKHH